MASCDAVLAKIAELNAERERNVIRSSLAHGKEITSVPPLAVTIIEECSISDDKGSLESGQVNFVLKNGHRYEGSVEAGLMHGQGKFAWCDGTVYEGEFCKGVISGHGTYYWIDGSHYVGEVKDGLRHGEGTFYSSNRGIHYSGQWFEGRRNGKGKLVYGSDGESWYDGEWKNDLPCGQGTRQYSSRQVYKGGWENGRRHGVGTMHWYDKGERYTGQWFQGMQHGLGEHIWLMKKSDSSQFPLQNHYDGQWVHGMREGEGTFYYASGAQFIGTWSANKKNGLGKFVLPTGQTVEGVFKEDKMVERTDGSGLSLVQSIHEVEASIIQRPKTPLGSLIGDIDRRVARGSTTWQFNLQVSTLIPRTRNKQHELHQVHCMVLRYLTQLKKAYHLYSSLGEEDDPTHTLTRMQLWQILMDCNIHAVGLTLFQANELIDKACLHDSGEQNNLTDRFLMRQFLQVMVFVAHSSYKDQLETSAKICGRDGGGGGGCLAHCMDQFMKNCFLPGICKPRNGHYHRCSQVRKLLQSHLELLHRIFTHMIPKVSPVTTEAVSNCYPTLRMFILLMADCDMFVGSFTATAMTRLLVQQHPLAVDDEDFLYLELPMVFLEFLEALLGCALLWNIAQEGIQDKEKRPSQQVQHISEQAAAESPDRMTKTPPEQPDPGPLNKQESGSKADHEAELMSTGFQPQTSVGDDQNSVLESTRSETPWSVPLEQDRESNLPEDQSLEDVQEDEGSQKDMSEVWQKLVPLFIRDLFLPKARTLLGL